MKLWELRKRMLNGDGEGILDVLVRMRMWNHGVSDVLRMVNSLIRRWRRRRRVGGVSVSGESGRH